MMLLSAIDAKENRYVVVSDIPGAFLHGRQRTHVTRGIIKLDPTTYRKHKWYNKHGKPMLYVQLKKALYGTLQAALLFWKLLSETLQKWGFVLKPYEKCVVNKNIDGNAMYDYMARRRPKNITCKQKPSGKYTMLKGIEYNSSTKGKCARDKEIVSINC